MKGVLYATLLVLCIFPIALAADFDAILPPDIPGSGIFTGNASMISITLKDSLGVQVQNAHISIMVQNAQYVKKTLEYTESGIITLYLPKGMYNITLGGDALSTPGGDYYYQGQLVVKDNANITIHFLPVGSLRGTAYIGNNIVEDAIVKFVCSKSYGSLEEMQTDAYGSFANDYLPVGECRVHAKQGDRIGYADVTIKPGIVATVDLRLDKQSEKNINYFLFGIIGAFTIIIIVIFFRLKSSQNQPQLPDLVPEHNNHRAEDLMKTFNEKECQIVKLLMEKGELYQNKIVYETNIPKTSLVRILMGLEQKKAIQSTQVGKTKKFKLTNWFLNKEKEAK